jgi:hypothetical protein
MLQNGPSDPRSDMGQRSHGQRKIWDNGGRGVSMRTRADSTTFTPNRSGQGSGLTKTTQVFGAQGMSVTASDEMLPNLRVSSSDTLRRKYLGYPCPGMLA